MSRQLGSEKEAQAVEYLTARGFKVIERNYRIEQGEIDIVALDGDALVFVEVKYRSNAEYGKAVEYVRPYKIRRIMKAAWHYIKHAKRQLPENYRIDVVAIDGTEINYYRNIPIPQ